MSALGSHRPGRFRAGLIQAVREVQGQACMAVARRVMGNDPMAMMATRVVQPLVGFCVRTGRSQALRLNLLVAEPAAMADHGETSA